jgi:hypothetical protein
MNRLPSRKVLKARLEEQYRRISEAESIVGLVNGAVQAELNTGIVSGPYLPAALDAALRLLVDIEKDLDDGVFLAPVLPSEPGSSKLPRKRRAKRAEGASSRPSLRLVESASEPGGAA